MKGQTLLLCAVGFGILLASDAVLSTIDVITLSPAWRALFAFGGLIAWAAWLDRNDTQTPPVNFGGASGASGPAITTGCMFTRSTD